MKTVLAVEDDPVMHDALRLLLEGTGFALTCACTARAAFASLDASTPDVALVDLGLPDMDGAEVLGEIRRRHPALPCVVLTVASSERRIIAALRMGAVGYLLKSDLARNLSSALEYALAGGTPLSPAVARAFVDRGDGPGAALGEPLSARETEVLTALARGLTYEDVARCLGLSVNTVRSHVRQIYGKLGVNSRTEAVMLALRHGLIGLSED